MKYSIERMKKLFTAKTSDLLNNPGKYFDANITKGDNYLFVNNGSSVLAVAHLDTVQDSRNYTATSYQKDGKTVVVPAQPKSPPPQFVKMGMDDLEITSIALDDRLGVYIIMDILPKLGINVDVLLTTDEEVGRSTASNFTTDKQYNWMFQFDRHGYGNVVMYDYETKDLTYMLENLAYDVQLGSFSDICSLEHLGCSGFNFGVGYMNEHTNFCRTRISWIDVCVSMFYDWYMIYKDLFMKHEPQPKDYNKYSRYGNADWYGVGTSRYSYTGKGYGVSRSRNFSGQDCMYCGTALYLDEDEGVCDSCKAIVRSEQFDKRLTVADEVDSQIDDTHEKCASCGKVYPLDKIDRWGYCMRCCQKYDWEFTPRTAQPEFEFTCDMCKNSYISDHPKTRCYSCSDKASNM